MREVQAVEVGNTRVLYLLFLLAVYSPNVFPSELYLTGHRPYEIYISWTIEEVYPWLNKPDDHNGALGLKLPLVILAYAATRKYLGYKIGNGLTKRDWKM